MKKMISLLLALVVCLSLTAPVFATENAAQPAEDSGFVPSITYKPTPEIVPVEDEEGKEAIGAIYNADGQIVDYMYDNDGHGCLLITPIAHIWDPEEDVPEDVERLLTFVYEELNEGDMEIPYEKHEDLDLKGKKMVIRDLFDARWVCEEHRYLIEQEGFYFEITFDLGIAADMPIYVMTYDEEADDWFPIMKTVNNGDGTVTCNFEHLCAIEFSMAMDADTPAEEIKESCPWWWWLLLVLVLVVVAIIIIIIVSKKRKDEENA